MQTNYERVIEAARRLSPEEIERLGEWARRQKFVRRESDENSAEAKEEIRKFNLAMKWISDHREEYLGKWVCLDGDKLISYGEDGTKIYYEAIAKGIESPFMEFVKEEEAHYSGGWEKRL